MVPIKALSTPECQEGVPSPGGQREGEHGGSQLCHYTAGCAIHPMTFRGSGWEYRVQIEDQINPECWEVVPSPGGQ